MNKIKIVITAFLSLFFSATTFANSNEITQAFASGNLSIIENYLNNNVEIIIKNTNNTCDKNKAKSLLNDFFRKYKPTNYSLTTNTERGKSAITLGKLYTNGGTFTLFIITQKESNKDLICQIKITENK